MTRSQMVKRLIYEGLSTKTLVNFSDDQLRSLCNRMISEEVKMIPKEKTKDIEAAQSSRETFMTYEGKQNPTQKQLSVLDKNKNKKIDKEDFKLLRKGKKQDTNESLMGISYAVIADKLKEKLGKNPTHDEINRELEKLRKELEKSFKKDTNKKSDVKEKREPHDSDDDKSDVFPTGSGDWNKKPKKQIEEKKGGKFDKKTKLALTLKKLKEHNEISEWVNNLAESNYHPFTSKGEIMELLRKKLNEEESMVAMPKKAKIGHNGIPEFMTYDAIMSDTTTKPVTKPKPGTKDSPMSPRPNINPAPSAGIKGQFSEDETTTKPVTKPKPGTKDSPMSPRPNINPAPSARKRK